MAAQWKRKSKGRCQKCLLPANAPGANIDASGVCEPCRIYTPRRVEEAEATRRAWKSDLEQALTTCRGHGEYDCLVNFSGGKDSVYLLYRLVHDYGLKVLAYTSNFDIPKTTWINIRRTVAELDVDHLVYTPPLELYRRFIRYLLQHQRPEGAVHTVCYFWLALREGDALRIAVEKQIPLVLAGYAPGQPDPDYLLYEMSPERIAKSAWIDERMIDTGIFQQRDLSRFWNPAVYPAGTRFPRFLAPFHAWDYDQHAIMTQVVKLGLVPNKLYANPIVSNFSLNWLFMYSDLKNLGYNPYLPEFASLIREKRASLRQWSILVPIVDFMIRRKILLGRHVKKSLKWLELTPKDLKIAS